MSVIVAVRKGSTIAMAADTQTNFGDVALPADNLRAQKIRPLGNSYIGKTGWGVYDNIFADFLHGRRPPSLTDDVSIYRFFLRLWRRMREHYGLVNDQCHEKDSPFLDLDASFLVVNRTGIFHVASDMSVTKFAKYYAVGAGNDVALGCLYALYDEPGYDAAALARKAVQAAMTFKSYCGGEIDCVTVRTRKLSR
jgi:ATP-dependent HslUV protease subunit HslV